MATGWHCEASDLISGIVSTAGSGPMESQECSPEKPLKVLHIHSTKDKTFYLMEVAMQLEDPLKVHSGTLVL